MGILATLSLFAMPLALAVESTSLSTTLIGNSVIDVRADESERIVHVYAEFDNFDINEKYFNVNVIQSESGNTVSTSQVNVYSTSDGIIDFGSMVGYNVNDRDLCSYDMSEAAENEVCSAVMTGDYEIEVTTKDGAVAAYEQITIIDSAF